MFNITGGKGFYMEFANGYGISVQWGFGSYSSNRTANVDWDNYEEFERKLGEKGSATAEIAVIDPEGNMCGQDISLDGFFEHDSVDGWIEPNRVLEVMNFIASIKSSEAEKEICDLDE